jgi:hypothetical protein
MRFKICSVFSSQLGVRLEIALRSTLDRSVGDLPISNQRNEMCALLPNSNRIGCKRADELLATLASFYCHSKVKRHFTAGFSFRTISRVIANRKFSRASSTGPGRGATRRSLTFSPSRDVPAGCVQDGFGWIRQPRVLGSSALRADQLNLINEHLTRPSRSENHEPEK